MFLYSFYILDAKTRLWFKKTLLKNTGTYCS